MATIALDLDHDGIRLLREVDDAWVIDGHVALEDPKLPEEMTALRDRAADHADGPLETVLMIPASEILYTDTDAPVEGTVDRAFAEKAIAGLTACPIEETVIDWRIDGDRVYIAALDVNTLDEAEEFAVPYGFNPVRFSARPPEGAYPGRPDFGETQYVRHRQETETPPAVPAAAASAAQPAQPVRPAADGAELKKLAITGGAALSGLVALGLLAFWLVTPDETILETLDDAIAAEGTPMPPAEPVAEAPSRETPATEAPVAEALAPEPPEAAMPAPGPGTPAARPADAAPTETAAAPKAPSEPAMPDSALPDAVAEALGALPPPAIADPLPATPAGDLADLAAPGAVPGGDAPPAIGYPTTLPHLGDLADVVARLPASLPAALPSALAPPPPDASAIEAARLWIAPPVAPAAATPGADAEIYLASIDPADPLEELYLLPEVAADTLPQRGLRAPLANPGAQFDYDDRGYVRATVEGTEGPGGYTVRLGTPPLLPPDRPFSVIAAPDMAIALALADSPPRSRPATLVERHERLKYGGRTRAELAALLPRGRPLSAQRVAARDAGSEGTELAVLASVSPGVRPDGFALAIAEALREAQAEEAASQTAAVVPASVRPTAPVASQPQIPTSASVARQATLENAIALRRMNLIGVYGSQGDRRALIRMPSGRYVKVGIGDRIDGGRVAAIGDGELRYVKGGRNVTLRVPSG